MAVSAPLLSHTPTPAGSLVKGGIKGWGDDDDKEGIQYIHWPKLLTQHFFIFAPIFHKLN